MDEIRRNLDLSYRQGPTGKELPWESHGAYLPGVSLKHRLFRDKLSPKKGTAPTYRARSARRLAGPMAVTEMMDAYVVPLLRISSMTTSADPLGDPPNAGGAYLPGKNSRTS